MKFKSKKAISFTLLLTPLMVILLLTFSFPVSSIEDTPQNIEYGKTTKEISYLSNQIIKQEFYLERLSKNILDSGVGTYLSSFAKSCFNSGKIYFYDESKNKSCIELRNTTSNQFTLKFLNSLQQEFSSYETLLNTQDQTIFFDVDDQNSEIVILSDFSQENINLKKEYRIPVDLEDELYFMNKIKVNIKQLSNHLSAELTQCTSISSNTKKNCVEELSHKYISNDLNQYNFQVDYEEIPNYFLINVEVKEKTSQKEIITFSLKFEDIVPFFHVDFQAEPYSLQDDIVKVTIQKPRESQKNLHGYIVLYSYDNFFDQSYAGYQELVSLLAQREKIPNDFEHTITPYLDNAAVEMRTSKDSSSFDVSLLFVPVKDEHERENSILLHQIYDETQSRYTALQEGNSLYVYVFAVDTSFTYYIDEQHFASGIEEVQISRVLPPKPLNVLSFSELSLPGVTSGISFSISGYQDDAFMSYGMYLCKSRIFRQSDLLGSCETITHPELSNQEGKYIIYDASQDISLLSQHSGFTQIPLSTSLIPGEDYVLYIVPQDSTGEFIFNKKSLQYKFDDKKTYFMFSKHSYGSLEATLEPFEFGFVH